MHLNRIIQQGSIPTRRSRGGVAGKVVGQNKSGRGRARKATGWGCNVELREEIRYATLGFTLLAVDLDSNPEIQCESSRSFPVVQRKKIRGAGTFPHIGNSSIHGRPENA